MSQSPTSPQGNSQLEIDLSTAHSQHQSPLFYKIPAEIRNEILRLALVAYDDPEKLYARETYWTRPGFKGQKKIDMQLLRVCKRIYEETKVVPLSELEVCFYFGDRDRRPPELHHMNLSGAPKYVQAFTPTQWSQITSIRFIAQMYMLEERTLCSNIFTARSQLKPSTVTITLRYTDWWWWEDNAHLSTKRFVDMNSLRWPDSVKTVIMEMETIEVKRKELDEVIKTVCENPDTWLWRRKDGTELRVVQGQVGEWTWQGPTTFGGKRTFKHHGTGDSMGYLVKVLTWKAV
ncbi:hypothetical protein BDV95DRAFT_610317 [Massariosphaeria phaeospora]|uniref:Uncharacterized protein n=1 Tax=Massariosphaeria phaeospora TaxID=100035 RepID=A0A7C8M435_9PLEO|nr:hypothetical protein BDV95DRAFT_610317 [Massariosphaeria phaeospora]